jgi:L-2,4-diaminobutyrate decarboxylase
MSETTHAPYNPEFFRRVGHRLVDELADYLRAARKGSMPVLPEPHPRNLAKQYQQPVPAEPCTQAEETFLRRARAIIEQSVHLHHPGYIAHQVAPPLPAAALAELLTGVLNQSLAVYEMSPAATHIERETVRWLCDLIGWESGADGIFTSGGSLGNLTALLVARNRATEGAAWEHGVGTGAPLAVLVGESAHYSVARAAGILGLGQESVLRVPLDRRYAMDVAALDYRYHRAVAQGRKIVAVVASASSTVTGTFDPLQAIGRFCRENGLWFHVDGAHGASVLLSPKYKSLAAGIELADSVVWDAHKLLFLPSLATAVLFRHGPHSYEAFRQQASYLFDRHPERDFDLALRTVECTKRMMAWKLWLALQLYGTRGLGELLTHLFDLGRAFAALIKSQPDFELLTEPMSNILCFRHRPEGGQSDVTDLEALNDHQVKIRRRVLESGEFFLVQTRVQEAVYLRTTLMNVHTTEQDLRRLLELIRRCAAP